MQHQKNDITTLMLIVLAILFLLINALSRDAKSEAHYLFDYLLERNISSLDE